MENTDGSTVHLHTDRPASRQKIADILAAARAAFFADGFSATSIEAIAARAKVSKVTVYTWFKNKENLFGEVVKAECDHMHKNFVIEDLEDRSLRDVLVFAGQSMLEFVMRDEMIRFDRILAAEVNRDPKIGEQFLDNGPRMLLQNLTNLLQFYIKRGKIQSEDIKASAEMLAGLVMGRLDMFMRYGQKIHLTAEERKERVERAVNIWMRIHQP